MAGAHATEPSLTIGEMPPEPWDGCARFALLSKDGVQLTELVVNPGPGKTLSLYEQDFLEGLVLQAGVAVENAATTSGRLNGRGCNRIWMPPARFSAAFCPSR